MGARRKSRRGGARPGAGRPPLAEETADLTVRFERAAYQELVDLAAKRGKSAATVVREAVRAYVARRRKG